MFNKQAGRGKSVAAFTYQNGKISDLQFLLSPSPAFIGKERFPKQHLLEGPGPGHYELLAKERPKPFQQREKSLQLVRKLISEGSPLKIPSIPTNAFGYQLENNGKLKQRTAQLKIIQRHKQQSKRPSKRTLPEKEQQKAEYLFNLLGQNDSNQLNQINKYEFKRKSRRVAQPINEFRREVAEELNLGVGLEMPNGRCKGTFKHQRKESHKTEAFKSLVSRFGY